MSNTVTGICRKLDANVCKGGHKSIRPNGTIDINVLIIMRLKYASIGVERQHGNSKRCILTALFI